MTVLENLVMNLTTLTSVRKYSISMLLQMNVRYVCRSFIVIHCEYQQGVSLPNGGIEPTNEFKFFLHRHWNLFDSMYHSRYIAVNLGVWRSKGQQTLEELMAKMGIPRSEYQQTFSHMSKELKVICDLYSFNWPGYSQ